MLWKNITRIILLLALGPIASGCVATRQDIDRASATHYANAEDLRKQLEVLNTRLRVTAEEVAKMKKVVDMICISEVGTVRDFYVC